MGNNNRDNLVSVVIPTYNRAHTLSRAIESVISQTYTNWEMIIVDNHSTDGTNDLIKSYQNQKIRLFKIHNDGIIAKSRNMGIENARGNYIAFLDSDDWWAENKLQVVSNYFNSDYSLFYHSVWVVSSDNSAVKKDISKELKGNVYINLLFNGNDIKTSSIVMNKAPLAEIEYINESKNMVTVEDYDTLLQLALRNNIKFYRIKDCLGYYQFGSGMSFADFHTHRSRAENLLLSHSHNLNGLQARRLISLVDYMRGRRQYNSNNYTNAKSNLIKVLNGKIKLLFKLKALWMLVLIILFNLNE